MQNQFTHYAHQRPACEQPLEYSWHLTHVDNLASIFLGGHGILCKNELAKQQVNYCNHALDSAQQRRKVKRVNGQMVHDYVPTFVTQRNPMMFCLRGKSDQLVWLKINLSKLNADDCVTSRYNLAANQTRFAAGLRPDILDWRVIQATYWNGFTDGSAARAAEILVRHRVPLKAIAAADVANPALVFLLEDHYGLATQIHPAAFFATNNNRACA